VAISTEQGVLPPFSGGCNPLFNKKSMGLLRRPLASSQRQMARFSKVSFQTIIEKVRGKNPRRIRDSFHKERGKESISLPLVELKITLL